MVSDSLKNLTYESEFPRGRKAQLMDGLYHEQAAPGSVAQLVIRLSDCITIGDLNGDGLNDAAVVLISNPGGSGTFYHLAAVFNRDGAFEHAASVFLGDRIQIKSVSIESGVILVNMASRRPGDPMTDVMLDVHKKYKLDSHNLRETP
jgi:hypothetical protein